MLDRKPAAANPNLEGGIPQWHETTLQDSSEVRLGRFESEVG